MPEPDIKHSGISEIETLAKTAIGSVIGGMLFVLVIWKFLIDVPISGVIAAMALVGAGSGVVMTLLMATILSKDLEDDVTVGEPPHIRYSTDEPPAT